MKNTSIYWQNKEERAKTALSHTLQMQNKYREKIAKVISKSVIYSPDKVFLPIKEKYDNIDISLVSEDSVSAIFNYSEGKTAVLNFASYKNPGGGFMAGSRAQEESLCHESFLYNVLRSFVFYYKQNTLNLNRGLYTNRAIYSPGVFFEKDNKALECDVITCAAPNITVSQKYTNNVSKEENLATLDSRIHFVLDIAAENQVDTLILGAFGCGVFGQDAEDVCRFFAKYLTSSHRCFKKVIFAIPNDIHSENYDKFFKVLTEEKEKRNEKL